MREIVPYLAPKNSELIAIMSRMGTTPGVLSNPISASDFAPDDTVNCCNIAALVIKNCRIPAHTNDAPKVTAPVTINSEENVAHNAGGKNRNVLSTTTVVASNDTHGSCRITELGNPMESDGRVTNLNKTLANERIFDTDSEITSKTRTTDKTKLEKASCTFYLYECRSDLTYET